jgi:hypothetical protein
LGPHPGIEIPQVITQTDEVVGMAVVAIEVAEDETYEQPRRGQQKSLQPRYTAECVEGAANLA